MEHKNTRYCTIIIITFFFLCHSLAAYEQDGRVRIKPINSAVSMAEMSGILPVDVFIDGAFLFSGITRAVFAEIKPSLKALINRVKNEITPNLAPEEKAEQILKSMHEHVLTTYREQETRLHILLEQGVFNCVSSAVLYAILVKSIDSDNLEVRGVRTSDHVFCSVQASGKFFDVETTSPYGFDPGSKKEFKDHFGKVTGYTYVPQASYGSRLDIDEKQLLSLILYNRAAFLSARRQYEDAVGPTVDAFSLLNDKESYDRMIVSFMNLASFYGMRSNYEQAINFLSMALDDYNDEERLMKLKRDILHNWVVALIDQRKLEKAERLLDDHRKTGDVDMKEWEKLLVYIYQIRAQNASIKSIDNSYERAAGLIQEALLKIGRNTELLKSFEIYIHNQFVSLISVKRYKDAEDVLKKAIIIYPGSSLLNKDLSVAKQYK